VVLILIRTGHFMLLKSKTPKTYKSNKLNQANFGDFTHNDYQVFLYLISKIGGVDEIGKYLQPEQLQREHVLTAKEFSEIFNTDIHNTYKLLNKACRKLMKTDLTLPRNESSELWQINVCSMAKYNKKEGYITIQFTDSIMPYLSQVREKFVLYNLKEIADFNSLYTTRLYELIQQFKDTGYLVKSLEQLREIFAVGNKFKKYNHFKDRTFDHACKEINNNYEMNLGYEEIKEGRKVVAVKFVFKKTRIHKVTNQRTGIEKNLYIKPKKQNKKLKESKKDCPKDVLAGQMYINKIKKEPKPIQGILSKMLNKFKF
jgi:plasmid replication initiation protein